VHLGYRRYNKLAKSGMNQREVDVNLAFQEAITRVISLRPDVTIIAGDLLHSVRPSNTIITFCFRQLRRLARDSGAPIIIVGGNHEAPKRVDTGSVLQLFGEIEGVHVADANYETFGFRERNLSVSCLPHLALVDRDKLQLRADDRYEHNILVVHAQVNEQWVSDFGGIELELKALSPHEWDYIALGHVHLHRTVGLNAAYPGALEHTAANIWGESKELKGFLEVNLPSGKRTFHPLTSPREVVVLESIDGAGLDPAQLSALISERANGVAGGIEGKIVRLEIRNVSRDSYRHLDHREIRELRARALNLTLDLGFAAQVGDGQAISKQKSGSLREELMNFSKTWDVPGITPDEVSNTLVTYLSKVEAKYEAS